MIDPALVFSCHCLHLCLVLVSVIVSTCVSFGSVFRFLFCVQSLSCPYYPCPCEYPTWSRFDIKTSVRHHACRLSCIWVLPHLTPWQIPSRVKGTTKSFWPNDLRLRVGVWSCIKSEMLGGTCPYRALKVKTSILNWIKYWTGNQWSDAKIGVMCAFANERLKPCSRVLNGMHHIWKFILNPYNVDCFSHLYKVIDVLDSQF